ncbi:hypothetical protein CRE_21491 [Caenorhabditis remanei]|uniref:Delta-like protein n=1 Tax=Caenorhabditis remanei TaxID=31234 RepID=E3N903_CAERE|nr:hypothetical protein CRE_21491 [Caenorhabditis remanei]
MLTNIPVTFRRPATVLITSGAVEKFGLKFETIRSERWDTRVMTISPERIHLPFSGFVIDIKCNRNWYGPYCDQYCNNELAETVNRRCTDSGALGCPLYSYGPKCDQRIHGPECECENKGVCVSSFLKNSTGVTVDELVCECPYGYMGKRCEQKEYEYAAPITVEMHGIQRKSDLMEQFYNQSLVVNELNVFRWI